MSKASTTFYTGVATTKAELLELQTDYTTYMQSLASQRGSIEQDGEMTETEKGLRQELHMIQTANDTYNREYQDRVAAGANRLVRPGLQTTQDLILAWFFGSYILLSLLLMIYVIRYTEQRIKKIQKEKRKTKSHAVGHRCIL
jgi:hypothetical protein